jgi:hypothetical protein
MGILIEMPLRNKEAAPVALEQNAPATLPAEKSAIDFTVWKSAPKERTANYFPTYSTISKAMQTAMRQWVREWFSAHPEILLRPHTAYPVLVYQATHPFSGKPTNIFTYDIQQTEALNRAFASAASKLGAQLKSLDTKNFPWLTREHYFAYRSKEVVKYVSKNRRAIYKMLNTETLLMDAILKFAIIDIPKIGLEEAVVVLQKAFATQLRRFSDEFDFSDRADDLLRIATDALLSKLPTENAMPLAA